MFTKHSLKARLLAICMLLAGLVGLAGGIGVMALKDVTQDFSHVSGINLPKTEALGEMRAQYLVARLALRTFGMEGLSPALAEKAHANLLESLQRFEDAEKRYQAIEFARGEQELYASLQKEWKEYKQNALRILDVAKRTDEAAHKEMQTFYFETAVANTVRFNAAMDKLLSFLFDQSTKSVAQARQTATRGNAMIVITAIAGFLFALFTGILFSAGLSRTLTKTAGSLAEGADEVASAATQISSTSETLSSGATEQASAIQETAASVDELSAMIKKNAENAALSVEVANSSQQSASRGKDVILEMIAAIDDISAANTEIMGEIEASNREISNIVKVIADIGDKTKVINDIVFQTKLLSFNASVEAARAGEHGKGFSVVAEEVGNLAQMSGNAAKEISSMLDDSIHKVEETVTGTRTKIERLVSKGKSSVEVGTGIARRCAEVLDELVINVGQVSNRIGEISSASVEQATGVQEITKAMRQLDQVTQQNTSASHQAAAASAQLASQAEAMRTSVAELLRAVNGTGERTHENASTTDAPADGAKILQLEKRRTRETATPSYSDNRFKESS